MGEAHPILGIITVGWGVGKIDLFVVFWRVWFDFLGLVVGVGSDLVRCGTAEASVLHGDGE